MANRLTKKRVRWVSTAFLIAALLAVVLPESGAPRAGEASENVIVKSLKSIPIPIDGAVRGGLTVLALVKH